MEEEKKDDLPFHGPEMVALKAKAQSCTVGGVHE